MSLTLLDAAKLSRNPLAQGVLKAVATSDELTAQIQMVPKPGDSFTYNREGVLAAAEFVSPTHTSVTESSTTFDKVTVPIRLLVTDCDVYDFAQAQQSELNDQRAVQITKKLKAAGRLIANKAISGKYAGTVTIVPAAGSPGAALSNIAVGPGQDTTRQGPGNIRYTNTGTKWAYRAPGDTKFGADVVVSVNTTAVKLFSDNLNRWIQVDIVVASATADGMVTVTTVATTTEEPDGLLTLIDPARIVNASGTNGDDFSFAKLDQLIDDVVKTYNNRVFVMKLKLKQKFLNLCRATGGMNPGFLTLPGITGPVPSYRGFPILQSDWIPNTETIGTTTNASSILFVDIGGEEGFYAGVTSVGGEQMVEADPRAVPMMGIQLKDVGILEGKDARRTRICWYGAFALGSALAAGRSAGVKTV